MTSDTPVLFLVWNRPDCTRRVFNVIRKVKPRRLFIAADGPRSEVESELKKCSEVRQIVGKIDWKCDVQRLYRERNLGLKKSVSQALRWFFASNNAGIVLEDDCLPHISFFNYCSLMLARYKNNKRVMHISGNNFLPQTNWKNDTYYFSKYPHIWGWASWKRAFSNYDSEMSDWPEYKNMTKYRGLYDNFWERLYWTTIFDAVYKGKIITWDYQWVYKVFQQDGLCINPGVNLVSNIGFGNDATNTKVSRSDSSNIRTIGIKKNLDNLLPKINNRFDKFSSEKVFKINPFQASARLIYYFFR